MTKSSSRLPNSDRAAVDLAKIRDYCLNPRHEDGKHKARVFRSALGLGQQDAAWLRGRRLEAATTHDTTFVGQNRFGALYVVDFSLQTAAGSAMVRSG